MTSMVRGVAQTLIRKVKTAASIVGNMLARMMTQRVLVAARLLTAVVVTVMTAAVRRLSRTRFDCIHCSVLGFTAIFRLGDFLLSLNSSTSMFSVAVRSHDALSALQGSVPATICEQFHAAILFLPIGKCWLTVCLCLPVITR